MIEILCPYLNSFVSAKISFFFLFYVHICLGTMYVVPVSHGGKKRVSGFLELELLIVVSCHVGAGN